MLIQIGIAGDSGRDPKYQPQTYLNAEPAQKLVYDLCHGPIQVVKIDPVLLDGLTTVQAVRIEAGLCHLNFTCFLREDVEILNRQGSVVGASLADAMQAGIAENPLQGLRFAPDVDGILQILFFLVGCVCLDWHGLGILARKGYTLGPKETERPAGGNYTIFGNEVFDRNLKEMYWGSHNERYGDYRFTSFGDHDRERQCLPDLVWRANAHDRTKDGSVQLAAVQKQMTRVYMVAVARHLLGERDGDPELADHLESMRYTVGGKPFVPRLVAEDGPIIRDFLRVLDRSLSAWIEANHESMERSFQDLAPIRQSVPWREALIQVWHYVFAHANRHLCRRGRLFDPYSTKSLFPGYLPVVFHDGCGLHEIASDG